MRKFGAKRFFSWTVHCAAVGGSAAYGCGIPLAGAARSLFGAPNGAPAGTQAKRFLWGEEEQRSVRSFRRKAETESSGLCDDDNGGADSLRRVGANPPRRGWLFLFIESFLYIEKESCF